MASSLIIRKYTAAEIPNAPADCLTFFVDSVDSILKAKDEAGVVFPFGVGTATELDTTGAPVVVSSSAPPVAGQVLMAVNPGTAAWLEHFDLTQTAVQTGTYGAGVRELVRVSVTGGNRTVNLPTAVGNANRRIMVKLVTTAIPVTNQCTITPFGGQTIDGAANYILDTDYEWVELYSDGANWMQVG